MSSFHGNYARQGGRSRTMKHTWGDSTELGDSEVDINIGSGEIDLREGEIYLEPWGEEEADLDLNIDLSINIVDKEGKEMSDGKRISFLWAVVVVEKTGEILVDDKVVADSEEEAKFVTGVYDLIEKEDRLEFKDVNVIVKKLSEVKLEKEEN